VLLHSGGGERGRGGVERQSLEMQNSPKKRVGPKKTVEPPTQGRDQRCTQNMLSVPKCEKKKKSAGEKEGKNSPLTEIKGAKDGSRKVANRLTRKDRVPQGPEEFSTEIHPKPSTDAKA